MSDIEIILNGICYTRNSRGFWMGFDKVTFDYYIIHNKFYRKKLDLEEKQRIRNEGLKRLNYKN